MARRRRIRSSISTPITLGAIAVLVSIALLVGWSFLLGQKIMRSADIAVDAVFVTVPWPAQFGSSSFSIQLPAVGKS